ncbi:FAD-dependent monooxygenase [Pseudonocardia sp. TRM90224]|uniref:FAD-dependent monooxygenase n=1 Tax=Pseudonocardia sp. TRM90224 TaxID=2812678 RepID=UPI001E432D98|nr:FAD-dependent monooxygenase [Pseudonocardia sp. TRM90224]
MRNVPVLIVGGGLAGLTSSLFLARQGVPSLLVDRHPGVSIHGKARGINQRTMEIYRAYGIADAVARAGAPFDEESGVAFCESLAGEWKWLVDADEPRAWPDLTAGEFCMADQNTVEPVLIEAARAAGAEHLRDTEMISFDVDADGVTATLHHRSTGDREQVRARYLVAADGNRSTIRSRLGIARTMERTFMHTANIVFRADLAPFVPRRALFWIIANPGGFSGGLVSAADPNRWQASVAYDPAVESAADFTEHRCTALVRAAVGAEIDVEIEGVGVWEQAVGVAEQYRRGRVFLVGDSAHVWPPAGALGANTGVQDAHNLAWKLAAVLGGRAGDDLLDTYDAERRPVAEALAPAIVAHQEARMGGGSDGGSGGAELDNRAAVLGASYAPCPEPGPAGRPCVGHRAPHLWLGAVAAHDLFVDEFVLLCDSPEWMEAARSAGVRAHRADHADGWAERYGSGAVLVRPDGYVAWCSTRAASAPDLAHDLADALDRALHPAPPTNR